MPVCVNEKLNGLRKKSRQGGSTKIAFKKTSRTNKIATNVVWEKLKTNQWSVDPRFKKIVCLKEFHNKKMIAIAVYYIWSSFDTCQKTFKLFIWRSLCNFPQVKVLRLSCKTEVRFACSACYILLIQVYRSVKLCLSIQLEHNRLCCKKLRRLRSMLPNSSTISTFRE